MRMPTQIFAECMDDQNHADLAVGQAELSAQETFQAIPGGQTQLAELSSIIAKVTTQAFGDGQHILSVGHRIDDLMADLFAEKQDLLLMTTRAKVPAFTRKWQQLFVATATGTDPGKALGQIAAF